MDGNLVGGIMRRNPFHAVAEIEQDIVLLHRKIYLQEQDLKKIIEKLKLIDIKHRKYPAYRNAFRSKEKAIIKLRAKLRDTIAAKRGKLKEGRKILYGNRKNEIIWRVTHRELSQELRAQQGLLGSIRGNDVRLKKNKNASSSKYDLFISHASEDKDQLVRPLADELVSLGLSVWYDEFSLAIGDSLRKSIDFGLSNSSFGLVILSSDFFAKNWTQYELNGLVSREMEGDKVILPIWHKVTKNDVMRFSPTLVDKVALNSSLMSVKEIAEKIAQAVRTAE